MMDDFTQLHSLHALIDRARHQLSSESLSSMVMNDPGTGGYVSAYELVLKDGVPALLSEDGRGPLMRSFDITENLYMSHGAAEESLCHRWFSVLTAGIELLRWEGVEDFGDPRPTASLRHLLVDGYALDKAGELAAPLDILPKLFQDVRAASLERHEHVAMLLAELLVAAKGSVDVEQGCRQLAQYHQEFQLWADEQGEPNRWYCSHPAFVWGAMKLNTNERRIWLELIEAHFPREPQLARDTRERLLTEHTGLVQFG